MAQIIPRTSYDHIVLLTDLTARSNSALSYARAFAQHYSSRLTLLHAASNPMYPGKGSDAARQGDLQTCTLELDSVANGLRSGGIHVDVEVCEDTSRDEGLLRSLERLNPNLIIQGTAGIDDPRRAIVGSIAEGIFRRIKVPVLTVRTDVMPYMSKGLRLDSIMFLTDFGSQTETAAIYALALAQEFRAKISLCHVYDGETAPWNRDDIRQWFERSLEKYVSDAVKDWCTPEPVVLFGDVATELRRLMKQRRPDLIVVGAYSLGPLGTRGQPGTAFKIVSHADCPVLSILSAPVQQEHPVYPDNCPDLIILG